MLPISLFLFLQTFISSSNAVSEKQTILDQATPGLTFQLRHLHALLPDGSQSLFSNVDSFHSFSFSDQLLQTNSIMVHKPRFVDSDKWTLNVDHWELEPVLVPNVSDRATLYELAKMCNNAYFKPDEEKWYNLGGRWEVGR
jgi:hypothetical protein